MEQIRNHDKQKRAGKPNSFVSVISIWCAKEDVKITFPDDIDIDSKVVREMLADTKNLKLF